MRYIGLSEFLWVFSTYSGWDWELSGTKHDLISNQPINCKTRSNTKAHKYVGMTSQEPIIMDLDQDKEKDVAFMDIELKIQGLIDMVS